MAASHLQICKIATRSWALLDSLLLLLPASFEIHYKEVNDLREDPAGKKSHQQNLSLGPPSFVQTKKCPLLGALSA